MHIISIFSENFRRYVTNQTDKQTNILRAIHRGDRMEQNEYYSKLFDEYYSYVYAIVYNRLRGCAKREDIRIKPVKHKIKIEKVGELPMKQIVNFMRNYNAQLINDSYYVGFYDPNIHLFEEKFNLVLDKHRLSQNDVKKIFGCQFATQDKINF